MNQDHIPLFLINKELLIDITEKMGRKRNMKVSTYLHD